jgi:hypothetical protein
VHVKTPREVHATALATVLLVALVLLAALACGGATTSGTSANSAGTTPASANPSSSARQTAPANGTAPASPASAVATFAGPLPGTDALVYLLAEGSTVNGYVCDGNEGKGDLSEWFAAASSNGTFTTTSKNGVKVTGSVAGDQVVGTVTLADGSAHAFTIPAVTSPAGLYRGRTKDAAGHDILGGWIVLPDGTQRGYIEQDNIRTVAKALTPKQIQDGTSNISDGTSNISDGTSNTLIPVSRVSAAFRAP